MSARVLVTDYAWESLDIERGILVQGAYIVVLLGAAWANFATRDITS